MSKERDESRRPPGDGLAEEALAVFDTAESPALTTRDVSDALGCSREVAHKRLQELSDEGLLERRESGRTVLWWKIGRNDYERAFGAFADTDVDEGMRAVRENLREEWNA